jgi:hypothetical protein
LLLICTHARSSRYLALSGTLKGKRLVVWEAVKYLIQAAEYLLVTDADLSDHELDVITSLRDHKTTTVYHNTTKRGNIKEYLFIPSFQYGTFQMLRDLKAGHNLYITCDSKKQARRLKALIEHECPDKKVLLYDGDSPPALKATIGQCDTEWPKHNAVIASPVITFGVDFNPEKPHFYRTYAFFKGMAVDDQSAFQMLERARKLNSKKKQVVVCLQGLRKPGWAMGPKLVEIVLAQLHRHVLNAVGTLISGGVAAQKPPQPMDMSELEDKEEKQPKEAQAQAKSIHQYIQQKVDPQIILLKQVVERGRHRLDFDKDIFGRMLRNTLVSTQEARANFATLLAARICYSGGTLRLVSARTMLEDADMHEQELKAVEAHQSKASAKAEMAQAARIAEARVVSAAEYKVLRGKSNKTADQNECDLMKKYQLVQLYGPLPEMDAQFVKQYQEPAVMDQHRLFFAYMKADHLQQDDLKSLALETFVWKKKHRAEAALEMARDGFSLFERMMQVLGAEFGKPFSVRTVDLTIPDKELRALRGQMKAVFDVVSTKRTVTQTRFADDLHKVCRAAFPKDILVKSGGKKKRVQVEETPGNKKKSKKSKIKQETVYEYTWHLQGPMRLLRSHLQQASIKDHDGLKPLAKEYLAKS